MEPLDALQATFQRQPHLWVNTRSHSSFLFLWRSLCHKISYVPTEWTELDDVEETSRQDLLVNVTKSGRGPTRLWSAFVDDVCHQSVVTQKTYVCGTYQWLKELQMSWPRFQVYNATCLPANFLVLALEIPCFGKFLCAWKSAMVHHSTWDIVLLVTCQSWILADIDLPLWASFAHLLIEQDWKSGPQIYTQFFKYVLTSKLASSLNERIKLIAII